MNSCVLNPESTMMQQSESHWQQYLAIAIMKLAPEGVTITQEDLEFFIDMQAHDPKILLTHGHHDVIELKLVTLEEATRLAKYDQQQKGSA